MSNGLPTRASKYSTASAPELKPLATVAKLEMNTLMTSGKSDNSHQRLSELLSLSVMPVSGRIHGHDKSLLCVAEILSNYHRNFAVGFKGKPKGKQSSGGFTHQSEFQVVTSLCPARAATQMMLTPDLSRTT